MLRVLRGACGVVRITGGMSCNMGDMLCCVWCVRCVVCWIVYVVCYYMHIRLRVTWRM